MEKTIRQQRWGELISDTIKNRDLYGRSFTAGVALYTLTTEGWLEEDLEDELDYMLHEMLGEEFYRTLDRVGHTLPRDVLHVLDIAVIDEIARELEGEE